MHEFPFVHSGHIHLFVPGLPVKQLVKRQRHIIGTSYHGASESLEIRLGADIGTPYFQDRLNGRQFCTYLGIYISDGRHLRIGKEYLVGIVRLAKSGLPNKLGLMTKVHIESKLITASDPLTEGNIVRILR